MPLHLPEKFKQDLGQLYADSCQYTSSPHLQTGEAETLHTFSIAIGKIRDTCLDLFEASSISDEDLYTINAPWSIAKAITVVATASKNLAQCPQIAKASLEVSAQLKLLSPERCPRIEGAATWVISYKILQLLHNVANQRYFDAEMDPSAQVLAFTFTQDKAHSFIFKIQTRLREASLEPAQLTAEQRELLENDYDNYQRFIKNLSERYQIANECFSCEPPGGEYYALQQEKNRYLEDYDPMIPIDLTGLIERHTSLLNGLQQLIYDTQQQSNTISPIVVNLTPSSPEVIETKTAINELVTQAKTFESKILLQLITEATTEIPRLIGQQLCSDIFHRTIIPTIHKLQAEAAAADVEITIVKSKLGELDSRLFPEISDEEITAAKEKHAAFNAASSLFPDEATLNAAIKSAAKEYQRVCYRTIETFVQTVVQTLNKTDDQSSDTATFLTPRSTLNSYLTDSQGTATHSHASSRGGGSVQPAAHREASLAAKGNPTEDTHQDAPAVYRGASPTTERALNQRLYQEIENPIFAALKAIGSESIEITQKKQRAITSMEDHLKECDSLEKIAALAPLIETINSPDNPYAFIRQHQNPCLHRSEFGITATWHKIIVMIQTKGVKLADKADSLEDLSSQHQTALQTIMLTPIWRRYSQLGILFPPRLPEGWKKRLSLEPEEDGVELKTMP